MDLARELEKMTVAQKLDAMEAIWANLTHHADSFEPPAWHKTLLDANKAAVRDGTATYSDWNEARERLRKKLT